VEEPDESQGRLRLLGRLTVVTLGLWFIADGLREYWSPLGAVATVLVYVGVVLAVLFVVVATRYFARRRGQD
jgi:hypothetical protein